MIAAGYVRFVRPWQLRWGATEEEFGRQLPGDDLVPQPTFAATRAITVRALPVDVWPWLAQVGVNRAGWYSYDWLDNLGRRSSYKVIPELVNIKVGDVMPMSPDGKHGIPVYGLEPPRSMIWGTPEESSWTWVLDEQADGTTRVITRVRSRYRWLSPSIVFSMLLEFADIWMMRRMLLNLRERVETSRGGDGGSAVPDSQAAPRHRSRPLLGLRRRPGRLVLTVLRMPLFLYRRGWGWLLGDTFMLLVHAGRKTGQPHLMTAMVMRYDSATREAVIFSGWGPDSDWVRNLRARPALRVEVGRDSYIPQHRFLSEDESVAVAGDFVRKHPHRVLLACRILGWPDLHTEAALRGFVQTHPFVALRPSDAS